MKAILTSKLRKVRVGRYGRQAANIRGLRLCQEEYMYQEHEEQRGRIVLVK